MTTTFHSPPSALSRSVLTGMALTASVLMLPGCASLGQNPRDPLEPLNRSISQLNDGVDSVALKPAAIVYRRYVPALVRTGVSNFFGNLTDGWSFVNSALQFKFQAAAENFMRLNVNTFLGLGGILDVASELNIERHKEDFGQTLGRWGVPAGPYVVLPLLGPSTLRDTFALSFDRLGDPIRRVEPWTPRYELYTLRGVDLRANLLRVGDVVDGAALDKYSFTRDAHLQRRRAEIFERKSDEDPNAGKEPQADGQPADKPAEPAPKK
ncbi:VacJ family lipoprotein [Caenimonas koreensis]|uniref:MlaA family lipoprotein n=1 Tax=Caenimonas koreensis TaxID=367474 RepID=UPI003783276A